MDHWDEDSEPTCNGLLPKAGFWNSFSSTWDRDKEPSEVNLLWQFHQNKSYYHLSQILTIRTPHTMYIHAKRARCWKYSPTDTYIPFPPGCNFQPDRNAVAPGLSFINTLCTRSESKTPILMENNNNHQITLLNGRIGFSSLDVVYRDEPKYQIRNP